MQSPAWFAPTTLQEALQLRADYGDEATVVAGGTFIGILVNQRLLHPQTLLSLRNVRELAFIEAQDELRLGAMTTHRVVERSPLVRQHWPVLAYAFSLVASPRVRNCATVGGVLADADYASDPPAVLHALEAKVIARSIHAEREIAMESLITGYYETSLRSDELITEVRIPRAIGKSVYRKFRSRSSEDRPCVAVAATLTGGKLRVVVGAVAEKPQYFPDICALATGQFLNRALATEIGHRYAESIDAITDARGSSSYRRRVIAVEIRRALEELNVK